MPYVIYDRDIREMLVGLRGDKRRAMELAITKANTEYDAFERELDAKIQALLPSINEAYSTYEVARLKLVEAFYAAIPEDIRPSPHSDPHNIRNNPHYYSKQRGEAVTHRQKLRNDLDNLRQFLRTKQLAGSKPKVQTDAPALKLIEEFDASRQLAANAESLKETTR